MKIASALAAGVLMGVSLVAQTPTITAAFDVASVKPNKGDGPVESVVRNDRVTLINVPLRFLIRSAYQLQDNQIVDAPAWTSTERFDVVGKAESVASKPGDLAP